MEEILPDMPKGLHNITKNKFKKLLSKSSLKLNPSSYMIKCDKNKKTKSDVLNELRFYYDIYFNVFKINKPKDSCPENFQIYFSDESKKAVYEKYDFYVYSLVWNPTYCRKLGKDCNNILKQNRTNILMIHGLWPSYKNGIIPQDCNLLEDIEINISNQILLNNLKNYWIGIGMENEEFWKYEYNKHGYCYIQRIKEDPIKNYYLYFQKTIDIYNKYNLNNLLKEMYPKGSEEQKLNRTYLSKNLDKKFGINTYALNCLNINERYYLYEIKLKLDLNFDFTNEGKTSNNCPEEFFAEFFEVEGPKKQHEGFMETYDIYIFSIIWLGTTCKIKGEQCLKKFKNVKKNTFTIHGLWPNYKNGTLPDWCNGKNDKEIKIKDKSLLDFMKKYYPSGYHSNEYFWGHEYNKHGYCYNQRNKINIDDYEKYFEKAKELYTKFDFENILINIYKNKIEPGDKIINRRDIEKQLDSIGITKDTYKIVCTNITNEKNVTSPHLLEIRIRFDLNFNLLKNETDVTEFDCPFLFKAFFL